MADDEGINPCPSVGSVAQGALQPGTDEDSGFSEISDDSSTYTASLASSIKQFRIEHGRTYHSFREGKYGLPNDEPELDRLDLQHHLFEMSLHSRLQEAPIGDKVRSCLDVGTAEDHPEAQVIGIDLSPVQPNWLPPNLQFLVDDAEDTWHYRSPFDFIHSRMMVGSIGDWPAFLSNALQWTSPGGWIELQDVETLTSDDGTFVKDPPSCDLARWWTLVCKAFDVAGRKVEAAEDHKQRLEAAGYVDVQESVHKWPISAWPEDEHLKRLGIWSRENTMALLEALALAPLTRFLGWSVEEVQVLLAGCRKDVKNTNIHAYWRIRMVWGRKPENDSK
ncbi:MAG: hypothetical protein M1822_007836 [Bathelium mastoideum]|nr:MAG: hypothetical protein M1822_007836 [Bathelium mastoideum]